MIEEFKMKHDHHHGSPSTENTALKNIKFAFLLNLSFAIIELIGGILTGSVAIIADAIHDFGDSLTLGLAIILEKLSNKKRTQQYTYGFRRLSLLAALISGIVLCVGSLIILYKAIGQLIAGGNTPNGPWMLALAVFGVVINGIAALRLRKGSSRNESTLSWHLIEDVLGWVAVFIGAVIITITNWTWVDPLLACLVATFILYNVARTLWGTIEVFLQSAPKDFNESEFLSQAKRLSKVLDVHDLHVWSLDGEKHIMSLHVVVNNTFDFDSEFSSLLTSIRQLVPPSGHYHVTMQIEYLQKEPETDRC